MLRVSWRIAAFEVGYSQRPVCAHCAEIELKFTIAPPPRRAMCGCTAFASIAADTTLTSIAASQSLRVAWMPLST